MSRFRLFRHTGTPTPTPTPSAVTYDTTIGNGVDSTGRADLTPRVGAHIIYVNDSTGSDASADPTNPSTPLKTVKKAVTTWAVDGRGDHILVAQGTSYSLGLANFGEVGGFSAAYPLTCQSYDPADPTNQAKWGTATGSNRPDIHTGGTDSSGGLVGQGTGETAHLYRAFRGLKFNAQNTTNMEMTVHRGPASGTPDYLLVENCEFAQTQISIDFTDSASRGTGFVIRNCSFHGQYDSTVRGDAQGLYAAFTTNFTIEDCVFWNCGWKEGANYTDSYTLGGTSIYGHPFYLQDDTRLSTVRRCVFIQNANDGGRPKGDCAYYQNLVINSDVQVNCGGGNGYDVAAPSGVDIQVSYNAFLGGSRRTGPSWGIHVVNGKSGSSGHHNVLAQASEASYGLMADAEQDDNNTALPCYINYHDNVMDNWVYNGTGGEQLALSGTVGSGPPPYDNTALIHATFNNNYLDATPSGTDHNISALTRPNRYTVLTLLAALPGAYPDLATAQTAWISDPASHGWRSGAKLALVGYGVDISAMPFLA